MKVSNPDWLIATRYFQASNRKSFLSLITFFAIGGTAISVAAFIITMAIVTGFSREIESKLVTFGSHITIQTFENEAFIYPNDALAILDTVNFIESAYGFYAREAIARSRKNLEGVMINGIADSVRLPIQSYLVEGQWFSAPDTQGFGLVIGKKMAQLLSVGVGDKLTLFGIEGEPQPGQFPEIIQGRVTGIYETGMQGFDDLFVYLPLEKANELFKTEGVNFISVTTRDLHKSEWYTEYLQEKLAWPYYVRSIYQTQANLFHWIALQQQMIPIIMVVLIAIALINIIGSLLMMILDKTRDIGILRAMGFEGQRIVRIFLFQGVFITLSGLILGNLLGLGFCYLQSAYQFIPLPPDAYFMTTVPIDVKWAHVAGLNLVVFVIAMLASWIPSATASNIRPVNALRFQ